MSVKNIKIRLNLNKENDRKVYDYLQSTEASYSKAVVSAICGYLELSEIKVTEDAFLERIIRTIREETAKCNSLGGLLQIVQTPSAQTPVEQENNAEAEETVMDFLDSF